MGQRVLVLTDSNYHKERDGVFPVAAHLSQNQVIESVFVADRADSENNAFYFGLDMSVAELTARPVDAHYKFETSRDASTQTIKLKDVDAVWIRLEYPTSEEFLLYLPRIMPHAFTVNNAKGLVHTSSKEQLMELKPLVGDMMPQADLCDTAEQVKVIADQCSEGVVLKQVRSNGGRGVVRYRPGKDTDLKNIGDVADYLKKYGRCLVMEYLQPQGPQSDNRVLVMNGVILTVVSRIPPEGSWICNITSGGSAEMSDPTQREIDVIKYIDPVMRKHGIFLYGVDMLLNAKGERVLSEVNTLNVGTIHVAQRLSGRPYTKFVADNLAAVINARDFHIPPIGIELIAA